MEDAVIYLHVLANYHSLILFKLLLFLNGMTIHASATLIELVFFLFSLNYC